MPDRPHQSNTPGDDAKFRATLKTLLATPPKPRTSGSKPKKKTAPKKRR